jgi:type IV pilus assembly protein PilM
MFDRLRQPISFRRTVPPTAASQTTAPELSADTTAAEELTTGVSDVAESAAPPLTLTVAPAKHSRKRRSSSRDTALVGLAIEPGLIVAAKSRVNGHLVVERAAFAPLGLDVVRDGEANDVPALADALSDLFKASKLERRVRIGIANQRIMMRRLELPPLTDAAEIHQAVLFQAQDEIPMPLESVVLDYHSLGISEGPQGPRLQVLVVAARKDMVERIIQAARIAGLQPEGVDLAAFGMIRALRPANTGDGEQILYLEIGGLTNLAISRGSICEFTRVITWGVEQIAGDVASRCGIPLDEARRLLVTTALGAADDAPPLAPVADLESASFTPAPDLESAGLAPAPDLESVSFAPAPDLESASSAPVPGLESAALAPAPDLESTSIHAAPLEPMLAPLRSSDPNELMAPPSPMAIDPEQVARTALHEGIRRIASEVRHSLDYYLAAQPGEAVTRAILCGPALEIPGFAETLSRELGLPIAHGEVELMSTESGSVPASILAVAAGLSVAEGPA